ncbi:MAG: tetratricopeptide repeat protein [Desulfobacterales bacterium]|nr:MAG: tetratricopeptide repeat protein [Desulfobacterales bacterium]
MKNIWRVGTVCFLMVSLIFACTAKENVEERREVAEASKTLGEAYLREGNFRAALKEFKKAEEISAGDYFLQDDLGLAYYYLKQYDLAIRHFRNALAIKDDYAPARNNLGNAYAQKKEWDQAIEQYKIVISDLLYATPQYPYSNLGVAYYHKKQYALSEKYYLDALEVKPNFVRALYGLAKTYMATGKVAEAIEKLEKAVESAPESAPVHFDLARAYSLKGDFRMAYAAYLRVVQLNPDSPLADQALREAQRIKPLL